MNCVRCGKPRKYYTHIERSSIAYHIFLEPPEGQVVLSLEERIKALERAVAELKEERST